MKHLIPIVISTLLGILTFLSMLDGEVSRHFATPMSVIVMMVTSSQFLLKEILDELRR